ncbi:MAG: type IV toxin-antitoxin system AbiEi family antitoxin domain-containing protein [Nitrososphaerales archaeon]
MLRQPSRAFGATEAAIYRRLVQPDGPKLLTSTDAMESVTGVGANSLSHTMSSLESKGVLKRIGKGVYLNRSTGLAPKIVDVIPWVFKNTRYYLGLNAIANHWGLSPQIPYSYSVIYTPKHDAQLKRVARWCRMLKKAENDLGGTIVPVVTRTSTVIDKGVSQSIVEGSQLMVSTIERTIIDAVVYTKEIGGAGEALLWTKAAMSKSIDYIEFEQVLVKVHAQVNSVAARLGFLLETALSDRQVRIEHKVSVDKLVAKLEGLATKTRATYNWGPEKTSAEYFQKWHLRVSTSYLKQLKEASSFE